MCQSSPKRELWSVRDTCTNSESVQTERHWKRRSSPCGSTRTGLMDRKEMTRTLDAWIATTYAHARADRRLPTGRNALKSYIIESDDENVAKDPDSLALFFSDHAAVPHVQIEATDDPTLHQLRFPRYNIDFFPRYTGSKVLDSAHYCLSRSSRRLNSAAHSTYAFSGFDLDSNAVHGRMVRITGCTKICNVQVLNANGRISRQSAR